MTEMLDSVNKLHSENRLFSSNTISAGFVGKYGFIFFICHLLDHREKLGRRRIFLQTHIDRMSHGKCNKLPVWLRNKFVCT